MFRLIAFAFAVSVVANSPIYAAESNTTFLLDTDLSWIGVRNADEIFVEVEDEIDDGCWTSISSSKDIVELELIRSGYEITDDSLKPKVRLMGTGYATDNYNCVVNIEIVILTPDVSSYSSANKTASSLYYKKLFRSGYIISGGKPTMSRRIKNSFQDLIQSTLVTIEKRYISARNAVIEAAEGTDKKYWKANLPE